MTRYKGRLSAKAIENKYTYIVEIAVPGGGFRRKTYDMAAWHRERGIDSHHGRGSCREGVWYVRWCFSRDADAQAFRLEFGGERVTSTS